MRVVQMLVVRISAWMKWDAAMSRANVFGSSLETLYAVLQLKRLGGVQDGLN